MRRQKSKKVALITLVFVPAVFAAVSSLSVPITQTLRSEIPVNAASVQTGVHILPGMPQLDGINWK